MTKHNDKESVSNNNSSNKRKWLTLSLVGVALLLIPRRSSRQDSAPIDKKTDALNNDHPLSL